MPIIKTVNRTYRSEAPVSIHSYEDWIMGQTFVALVKAGRGKRYEGVKHTARAAYKEAMSLYRFMLSQGACVPAIIDETGKAL